MALYSYHVNCQTMEGGDMFPLRDYKFNCVIVNNPEGMMIPKDYSKIYRPKIDVFFKVLDKLEEVALTKNDVFQLLFYIDVQGEKKLWISHLIFRKRLKAKRQYSSWKEGIIVGNGGFFDKNYRAYIIDDFQDIKIEW